MSESAAVARRGLKGVSAKLVFLAWVGFFLVVEWVRYGPYGPLGRLVGYQTIIRAQELLLKVFSAKSVFE